MNLQRRAPLLTPEAEKELTRKYHDTRDPELARRLAEANLGLVLKVVHDSNRDPGFFADLFQEGCIGLILAIRRFDPDRNVRLATYATWWIRSFVFKALRRQGNAVIPGDTRKDRLAWIAGQRPPADRSLDTPVLGGDRQQSLLDFLPAPPEQRPDRIVESSESNRRNARLVHGFVDGLAPRERDVMSRRWLSETPSTLAEVGNVYGVSGERIRQIENDPSPLPESTRAHIAESLNARLADGLDLHSQIKVAHWNIKGRQFASLHPLFETFAVSLANHNDVFAERAVTLGARAYGTVRHVAKMSRLPEYPQETSRDLDHVRLLAERIEMYLTDLRGSRALAEKYEDTDTADLFTQVITEFEKHAWFLRASLEG